MDDKSANWPYAGWTSASYINELVYINDLPSNLTAQTRLFADDNAAYNTVTSLIDQVHLQKDLDQLA